MRIVKRISFSWMEYGEGGFGRKRQERFDTVFLSFPVVSNWNGVSSRSDGSASRFFRFFLEASHRYGIFPRLIALGNCSPALRYFDFVIRATTTVNVRDADGHDLFVRHARQILGPTKSTKGIRRLGRMPFGYEFL